MGRQEESEIKEAVRGTKVLLSRFRFKRTTYAILCSIMYKMSCTLIFKTFLMIILASALIRHQISRSSLTSVLPQASFFSRVHYHKLIFGNHANKIQNMSAQLLDGKAIANKIQEKLKKEIEELKSNHTHFTPHLSIVQVGEREDSNIYVRMKEKLAKQLGLSFSHDKLPETISQSELLTHIQSLNHSPTVHGILVQMPLPSHISESAIISAIDPHKDVDGFHVINIGNLSKRHGEPLFLPCTPKGIMALLAETGVQLEGKRALVIGRSNIVGLPAFLLLNDANATVTLAHSKTVGLEHLVKEADILVVAVGKPELVKGSWIKPGAIVIDVGTNSVPDSTKKAGMRWVGDVEFNEAQKIASFITPVPGGVGPMTVIMLMDNTVLSAKRYLTLSKEISDSL